MAVSDSEQKTPDVKAYLQIVNRLIIKTSAITNRKALIFHIVNDTYHLIRYDHAFLFSFQGKKPELIGASGETDINKNSPLVKTIESVASGIKTPDQPVSLMEEHFTEERRPQWQELQKETPRAVFWVPIFYNEKLVLGLWLEQQDTSKFLVPIGEAITLLKDFLVPAFGIAWHRITGKFSLKKWMGVSWRNVTIGSAVLLAALLLIRVPLRVAAPCEVVPKDPYIIRAPLEGVINEVLVEPGQAVVKDAPLFEYDKNAILQALKSAQKEVLAKEFELKRTVIQSLDEDPEALNELVLRTIEKQKALIDLDFNEYQASLLTVKAPQEGVIYLESPDIWRGRPVKVGEKVLEVSNPKVTSIKIWIPEKDNITLDPEKLIKIFLNIAPATSYQARIEYIGNEITFSKRDIPSYVAKANWVKEPPENVNIGIKGTAILYGESVSLFYYLFRKPWYTLRNFLGM